MILPAPTIGDLETAGAARKGEVKWVFDGADSQDATTGGGSYQNLVYCDGTIWLVVFSAGDGTQNYGDGFARVKLTANQSIATSTFTALNFGAEDFDYGNCHDNSTNNSRLTAPVAGVYLVTAFVRFAASSSGRRQILIHKNGAVTNDVIHFDATAVGVVGRVLTSQLDLAASDYIECNVWQSSGGNLNVSASGTFFAFSRVRP